PLHLGAAQLHGQIREGVLEAQVGSTATKQIEQVLTQGLVAFHPSLLSRWRTGCVSCRVLPASCRVRGGRGTCRERKRPAGTRPTGLRVSGLPARYFFVVFTRW